MLSARSPVTAREEAARSTLATRSPCVASCTLQIPLATVVPEPMRYTWLNKVSYDLSGLLLWAYFGASFNKFRAKLGVGPQSGYILDGISQVRRAQ